MQSEKKPKPRSENPQNRSAFVTVWVKLMLRNHGEGTTSVVPHDRLNDCALAPEDPTRHAS